MNSLPPFKTLRKTKLNLKIEKDFKSINSSVDSSADCSKLVEMVQGWKEDRKERRIMENQEEYESAKVASSS